MGLEKALEQRKCTIIADDNILPGKLNGNTFLFKFTSSLNQPEPGQNQIQHRLHET